jgi:hypothetical protein
MFVPQNPPFSEDDARRAGRAQEIPLRDVLVAGSSYNRHNLKRRLLAVGLLAPVCELCGQDELWHVGECR